MACSGTALPFFLLTKLSQSCHALGRLVTGFSPLRTGFVTWTLLVRFVMEKVALGQVFLWVFQFFPVSIFHRGSRYSYIIWGKNNNQLVAAVQRYVLAPSTWTVTTGTSETSVYSYKTTWCNISECCHLHATLRSWNLIMLQRRFEWKNRRTQ
jgi:hypothetical protein